MAAFQRWHANNCSQHNTNDAFAIFAGLASLRENSLSAYKSSPHTRTRSLQIGNPLPNLKKSG
jgi:hypothetical protein